MPLRLKCRDFECYIKTMPADKEQRLDYGILYSALPDLEITAVNKVKPGAWQITYAANQEKDTKYSKKTKEIILYGRAASDWDFSRIGSQIISRLAGEKGFLFLHAAAVSKDSKGILLLGNIMAGKTLSTMALCLDDFYFISGEHTIIDPKEYKIISGTKVINCKPHVIKKYFDINVSAIFQSKNVLKTASNPANLELIVQLKTLPDQAKPLIYELSDYKRRMLLYENASEILLGNFLTHGQTKPVQNLDTPHLSKNRAESIVSLIKNVPMLAIEASPKDLANIIKTQI